MKQCSCGHRKISHAYRNGDNTAHCLAVGCNCEVFDADDSVD